MTSEDQTDRIQQLEKRIEELENKQQLSKLSRRGLLGGIFGVAGLGAMSGSGAAASGQVGTANSRVNVFADTVDANQLTGVSTGADKQGCRVFLSSDQSIGQATRTKIQFDSEVYDSNSNFDTSTHNWTCPKDGLYIANLNVHFRGGGADENRSVGIGTASNAKLNNTGIETQSRKSDKNDRLSVSTINKYTSGDTIAGYAANFGQSDVLGSTAQSNTTFLEVAFLGGL